MNGRCLLILTCAVLCFSGGGDAYAGRGRSSGQSINVFSDPVQIDLDGSDGIPFGEGRLTYLASYDISARVMGKRYYRKDKEAAVARLDMALGWQNMSEPAIYDALNITMGDRWYKYSWPDYPPLPEDEIIRSSANVHLIPANEDVKAALNDVRKGQSIRMRGYLVEYSEGDENKWWRWKSSLRRDDTGEGSCELFYVETVTYD